MTAPQWLKSLYVQDSATHLCWTSPITATSDLADTPPTSRNSLRSSQTKFAISRVITQTWARRYWDSTLNCTTEIQHDFCLGFFLNGISVQCSLLSKYCVIVFSIFLIFLFPQLLNLCLCIYCFSHLVELQYIMNVKICLIKDDIIMKFPCAFEHWMKSDGLF